MGSKFMSKRALSAGKVFFMLLLALVLLPALASAHPGHPGHEADWVAGLLHPLTGIDHLLALLGVGIWSRYLDGQARWAVPTAFAGSILLGGGIAAIGVSVPGIGYELGIASSVVILGALVATARVLPTPASVALASLFAVCHGYAHVAELHSTASAAGYVAGFMAMSILCIAAGVGLGTLFSRGRVHAYLGRAVGLAIALVGVFFVAAQFGV